MNSYLITFDTNLTEKSIFVQNIDSVREIQNWMMFFENSGCIISNLSAKELTGLIRARLPEAQFIIVNLEHGKRSGWLRKSVWDFIREPKPVSG